MYAPLHTKCPDDRCELDKVSHHMAQNKNSTWIPSNPKQWENTTKVKR